MSTPDTSRRWSAAQRFPELRVIEQDVADAVLDLRAFWITTESIGLTHPFYERISRFEIILGLRTSLTAMGLSLIFALIIGTGLAHYTRFGRNLVAIGSNGNPRCRWAYRSARRGSRCMRSTASVRPVRVWFCCSTPAPAIPALDSAWNSMPSPSS